MDTVRLRLWEVDFEEGWVKFRVPDHVMALGFHAGSVDVDFSGVQSARPNAKEAAKLPTTPQGQNGTAGKPQVGDCTTSAIT